MITAQQARELVAQANPVDLTYLFATIGYLSREGKTSFVIALDSIPCYKNHFPIVKKKLEELGFKVKRNTCRDERDVYDDMHISW